MITDRELQAAIEECEKAPASYQNCEKLATFYAIHDHRNRDVTPVTERLTESTVSYYSDTAFGQAVGGKPADDAWAVMDELMEALMVVNPRLYESVMRKLK